MMKAIAQVDSLLADYPGDPYFNELKGDILFKNGKAKAAVPYYQAAVDACRISPMLLMSLGRTQRETNDPAMIKASIENLKRVVEIEPANPGAWKNLGIAYGLNKQDPEASLALAESAITSGDRPRAQSPGGARHEGPAHGFARLASCPGHLKRCRRQFLGRAPRMTSA